MSDRGARRGLGAPFYAAPRRKTSAEIISEARAAINGAEMAGSSVNSGGAVRPLRTRRPFTPREPQRTLFSERTRKDNRPPSALDLKYLTLTESSEEALVTTGARVAGIDEETFNSAMFSDTSSSVQSTVRKKPAIRNQSRSVQDRSSDGWSGFTKLPHLSGRAKPLHRRSISHATPEESAAEYDLAQTILITRPSGMEGDVVPEGLNTQQQLSKSPDPGPKRKVFACSKSQSYDASVKTVVDIDITHIEQPTNALPSNTKVDYMSTLELCEALSRRAGADRSVLLLQRLQTRLEESAPAANLREMVLRALYGHVDSEDERVLVAIARAMLTMRVTGNHLAAACKLVFKIAKNDKNDHFFRDTNLIELLVEGCGRLEPVSESECCVYGAGALRVLALEPGLRARAVCAGAVHLAAIHLQILNAARAGGGAAAEACSHALYQVTGALRNLATDSRGSEFLASGALAALLDAALAHTDRDVLTNVARCLSVLSAQESCCLWLCARSGSARALLRALAACGARPALAVRLAYTLGNMAAADERARDAIYNEEGGIDVLLTILESYTKRNDHEARDPDLDPDLHLIGTDLGGSDGSNEDVLIKTVRVVANLCLAERAGRGLAATHAERTVKALLACLLLADKPTDDADSGGQQADPAARRAELATAALATLNNITYYRDPPAPPDPLDTTLDHICRATCGWLSRGGEAACEAARALGNLTRCPRLAQLFLLEGALHSLTPFLDHEEESVRCSAAGVLVNVCGCGGGEGAAGALAGAARRGDAGAAALLARALWNAHTHAPLHAHTRLHAARALQAFIHDESVFEECEASNLSDRRASDPPLHKYHVTFENNNGPQSPELSRAVSVDRELHAEHANEDEPWSGDDLGFEEGDVGGDPCPCRPCRRLAAWEELVEVALPLLQTLGPPRLDAAVGTD